MWMRLREAASRRRLLVGLVVLVGAGAVVAQELPTIRHRPIQYFVPGHRIEVLASVSDESGVDTVRCYFRQKGAVEYTYVEMTPVGGDQYRGVLPAPANENDQIEYAFLLVTGARCVFRTEPLVMGAGTEEEQAAEPPRWQQVAEGDPLLVGTDLEATLAGIPGFDDTIDLTAAAPEERYGVTGGVYGEEGAYAAEGEGDDRAGGALLAGPPDVVFCSVIPASAVIGAAQIGAAGGGAVAAGVGVAAAAAGGIVAATNSGGGGGGGTALDPSLSCNPDTPVTFTSAGSVPAGDSTGDPWVTVVPFDVGPSPATPIQVSATILGNADLGCGCSGNNDFEVVYEGVIIASTGRVVPGSPQTASGVGVGTATEVTVRVFTCDDGCREQNGHSWELDLQVTCGGNLPG